MWHSAGNANAVNQPQSSQTGSQTCSAYKNFQCKTLANLPSISRLGQTREGTYQLKRRRLKPDVRDPPEHGSADVDMADI